MQDLPNTGEVAGAWDGGTTMFRALIDNLEQGVCVLDRDGRCLAVNRVFQLRLERPEGELVGQSLFDSWPEPLAGREVAEHQRVLRGERIEKEEEWPIGRCGPRVRILKVPLQDAQGRTCGVLCLLREAPPLRFAPAREETGRGCEQASEASGREAWKWELVGRLVGGVVHDLRNLLALQITPLAMVRAALLAGTSVEEPLRVLGNSIDLGAALVERLMRVVRGQGDGTSPGDVNAACAEVADLLKHNISHRISLQLRLRPGLPPLLGGATEIRQVLLNLCLNACDAMPRGGQLLIETDLVPGGGGAAGEFICLRVSDTGEGMPPEVQARIFEPSFTTKASERNTGLGLAIASEIVSRMGGRLECHSAVGEGTCFTIQIPDPSSTGPIAISPSATSKGVLLVESEPSLVLLVRAVLEPRGFRIWSAEDGRGAVALYRQRQADVDIVLLDHNLPDLSAPETMGELVRINPYVRVLLVSGSGLPATELGTKRPGLGLLSKPYTPDELLQAMQEVLAVELKEDIAGNDLALDLA
ncbi:MAG TPA: ATP-binding protein [Gemmataceae bacterium]|jgi:signal transduction histidine kinase/ActR/RegA family two-component response regulator